MVLKPYTKRIWNNEAISDPKLQNIEDGVEKASWVRRWSGSPGSDNVTEGSAALWAPDGTVFSAVADSTSSAEGSQSVKFTKGPGVSGLGEMRLSDGASGFTLDWNVSDFEAFEFWILNEISDNIILSRVRLMTSATDYWECTCELTIDNVNWTKITIPMPHRNISLLWSSTGTPDLSSIQRIDLAFTIPLNGLAQFVSIDGFHFLTNAPENPEGSLIIHTHGRGLIKSVGDLGFATEVLSIEGNDGVIPGNLELNGGATGGDYTVSYVKIGSKGSRVHFGSPAADPARITFGDHCAPGTTDAYDFGLSSYRWRNIYAKAGLFDDVTILAGNLELSGSDILNVNKFNFDPLTSAPGTPTEGDLYFNGDTNTLKVHDGSNWRNADVGAIASGDDMSPQYDGWTDSITGWSISGPATNLRLDTTKAVSGTGSIAFDRTSLGNVDLILTPTHSIDLSQFSHLNFFVWDGASGHVEAIELHTVDGTDYFVLTSPHIDGYLHLFDWSNIDVELPPFSPFWGTIGSPDLSSIVKIVIRFYGINANPTYLDRLYFSQQRDQPYVDQKMHLAPPQQFTPFVDVGSQGVLTLRADTSSTTNLRVSPYNGYLVAEAGRFDWKLYGSTDYLTLFPNTLRFYGVDLDLNTQKIDNASEINLSGGTGYLTGVSLVKGGFGMQLGVLNITSDTTLVPENCIVFADASAGTIIVTLPVTPVTGQFYIIKKVDSSTNSVDIDGNGKSIDSNPILSITTHNQAYTIAYNGTEWFILEKY